MDIGNKVMITGCCGSGKSTLSRKLADRTGLPLFHLDMIWWRPDESHIPREEFDRILEELTAGERWIIEGDYSRTYEARLRACDTLIFLDYNEETCMEGLRQRVGQKRSDIPWVEQRLDQELVDMVCSYRQDKRPRLMSLLEQYPEKHVLVFHTRAEADAWLETVSVGPEYELCCDFGYDVTSPIPSVEPIHRNFHCLVPAVVGTTVELFPGEPERYEYAEFVSFLTDENGRNIGIKCRIKPSPRIIKFFGELEGMVWEVDLFFGKEVFAEDSNYDNGKNTHTYRRMLLQVKGQA